MSIAASAGTDGLVTSSHVMKGESAQLSSLVGAIAVADLVKTTLGPKGMDKILQSVDPNMKGKVTVTNDGATILKSIPIDNASAKILVNISRTQDDEVGDGTTSVVVLAGELLREAEKLVAMKIHPQTIVTGWRKAVKVAISALEEISVDNSKDADKFRQDLLNIAHTTLCSKIVSAEIEHFSSLCVDAILRLQGHSIEMIHVLKVKGGQLKDSFLADGFILNKEFGIGQKKVLKNPKIMVANTPMDTDKIKILGAKVMTSSVSQVAEIEAAEKEKMKAKVKKILNHNIDLFINRQLIYNYPEEIFADNGVASIEHADFEGVERLALVLGADIVSTFDTPDQVTFGKCELVEERMIGENKVIAFEGVEKGEACTIVLRGSSEHLIAESERSVHDALCVLSQTVKTRRTVLGGGASEVFMATRVEALARKTAGKQALAIEAFARALRCIPTILADNGGYDSSELVANLRSLHEQGKHYMGLNMSNGTVGDMRELRVTESFKSKSQSLVSAHEAAEMILRVDDIIRAQPRQRVDPRMG